MDRTIPLMAFTGGRGVLLMRDEGNDSGQWLTHEWCTSVALSPDGTWNAYSTFPDAVLGRSEIVVDRPYNPDWPASFFSGSRIGSLVFEPHGNFLVSTGTDQFTVWDLTRRESQTARTMANVREVRYSRDGTILVFATNTMATLFNADASHVFGTVELRHEPPISAVAITPDNRSLLIAAGPAIHFFEITSGIHRRTLDWNVGPIHCIAVSPDGLTAATGADRRIVVWDLDD